MTRLLLFLTLIVTIVPAVSHAENAVPLVSPVGARSLVDEQQDRDRAIDCLATAIAYEAGYEPLAGQQAVAEVILNRRRHPAYPKTVCGVVFSGSERRTGCQFSFTCDGSLARALPASVMTATREVAASAIDGLNPVQVAGATHYHADYVAPYWAPSLVRIAKIGAHIFYRGAGSSASDNRATRLAGEPAISQLGVSASGPVSSSVEMRAKPPVEGGAPKVFAPWGLVPTRHPATAN